MVARFLLLLQVLLQSLISGSLAQSGFSTCYFPSGNVSDEFYPCNDNEYSMCCPSGMACLDTPLCWDGAGYLVRGTCSDSSFSSPNCPSFCFEDQYGDLTNSWESVWACNSSNVPGAEGGNHDFCCGSEDCCDNSNATDLVPLGGLMAVTATWDTVASAFTALSIAEAIPFIGLTATGYSTYGYASDLTSGLAQATATTTATITADGSASTRLAIYSYNLSFSNSMLSSYTQSPSVNIYTENADTTKYHTTEASTAGDAAAAIATASTVSSGSQSSQLNAQEQDATESDTGLKKSSIVGIAVGCGLAGIAFVLAILYCCWRRKRRAQHNTADSHNNPHHYGMRRDSDVPETASMMAEADPAHEIPAELGGRTWVEAPEKGSHSKEGSTSEARSEEVSTDESEGHGKKGAQQAYAGQDELVS